MKEREASPCGFSEHDKPLPRVLPVFFFALRGIMTQKALDCRCKILFDNKRPFRRNKKKGQNNEKAPFPKQKKGTSSAGRRRNSCCAVGPGWPPSRPFCGWLARLGPNEAQSELSFSKREADTAEAHIVAKRNLGVPLLVRPRRS